MEFTFLMCSERSGSNLLTKIMDSHSQYCGPSPAHLFRMLLENRLCYGDLHNLANWETLLQDAADLLRTQLGVWKTDWDGKTLQALSDPGDLLTLLRGVYEAEARANNKTRLFIKENHLYRYVHFILAGFREARVVYLVRDPRDMALSWKRSPILRGCVIRAANVWKIDQCESLKLFAHLRDLGKIILLRYEDLISRPETELRRLCEFLEIPFEARMLDFSNNRLTTRNARRSADWQNLEKPIMNGNFHKYKAGLSEAEIRYVETLCGEEMELLGYHPDFPRASTVDQWEEQIAGLELYEKPGYMELSPEERRMRRENQIVFKRIQNRDIQPILEQVDTNEMFRKSVLA